jgi:hypothetical protein
MVTLASKDRQNSGFGRYKNYLTRQLIAPTTTEQIGRVIHIYKMTKHLKYFSINITLGKYLVTVRSGLPWLSIFKDTFRFYDIFSFELEFIL